MTTRTDKLRSNFKNPYFDQFALFKEGDRVSVVLALAHVEKDFYFYQLKIAEKLARVLHLKNVAGQFFKIGDYLKAAKLYQRVNGYFNFGDTANNYQKEDAESEAFIQCEKDLKA